MNPQEIGRSDKTDKTGLLITKHPVNPRTKESLLTNMHNVSVLVDHDVAVVPVLDLEQEAEHGVRRHRGDEGAPRILYRYTRMRIFFATDFEFFAFLWLVIPNYFLLLDQYERSYDHSAHTEYTLN